MKGEMLHPCFSNTLHARRRHFAIAKLCNIRCNYCELHLLYDSRRVMAPISPCLHRPGIAGKILSADEAFLEVERDFSSGQHYVVGVAGPGDSLANPETLIFFGKVYERFPDTILCTCTNGLLLYEKLDSLLSVGLKAVTVTMNALNPEVLAKIVSFVDYNGKRHWGIEGAEILVEKQKLGLQEAVKAGLKVKVNLVLIPGINDSEIERIAIFAGNIGVYIMNITGLIPAGRFKNLRRPGCEELVTARDSAELYIKQFRRCQQCRADADGFI